MSVVDFRRALEALRSGVPNTEAVRVLGSNQTRVQERFIEMLSALDNPDNSEVQPSGLLVKGGFGSGKSHLLEYLEDLALSRNFVCSRVVISKETPLFDPSKVYRAAIESASVPGVGGQAMHEIALGIKQDRPGYARLYFWANQEDNGVAAIFPATLLLHERLNNDPELVEEIRNFWSGEKLPVKRVRDGLKQIGQGAAFDIKRVAERLLGLQRFIFAARLIRGAGYSGWVLLIDEVELVGRYSVLQRGKSYAELARWMGAIEGQEYPGLAAVLTITDDFEAKVLDGKQDRDVIAPKFHSKDTDEYRLLAAQAEVGMRIIERDAITLKRPDEDDLSETYRKLRDIHAGAYGWRPPDVDMGSRATTRAMRSYVRRCINEWDLKRIYPYAAVNTQEDELAPTYLEDLDLEKITPDELEEANGSSLP